MEEKFKYPKPRPLIKDNQRFCSWCWQYGLPNTDSGLLTILSHHKKFLCSYHYKIFRQDRECARIRFKRDKDKKLGFKSVSTELGTSDLAKNRKMKEDGTPDFDDEYKRVHKELELTMKYGTSDYNTIGIVKEMPKPKKEDYIDKSEQLKNQVYSEDENDIITYEVKGEGDGTIVDQYNSLEYEWVMLDNGEWVKLLFDGVIEPDKKRREYFEY